MTESQTPMNAPQNLLDALGARLGLQLVLGESQHCALSFDDTLILSFLVEPGQVLTLLSHVADIDALPADRAALALRCNFSPQALAGAQMAVDADTRSLVLTRSWEAAQVSADLFFDDVEQFVNLLSALRRQMTTQDPETPAAPADPAAKATSLSAYLVRLA